MPASAKRKKERKKVEVDVERGGVVDEQYAVSGEPLVADQGGDASNAKSNLSKSS